MKARSTLAAITIGLSAFSAAWAGEVPSAQTKPVLACLLGMAPDGCENDFLGFTLGRNTLPISRFQVHSLISYCAKRVVHRRLDNCYSGPLESVKYLGTNAAGSDVYDIEFQHMEKTYVISPPGPDGKVSSIWIIEGSTVQALFQNVARVTSPVTRTLYVRPREYAYF